MLLWRYCSSKCWTRKNIVSNRWSTFQTSISHSYHQQANNFRRAALHPSTSTTSSNKTKIFSLYRSPQPLIFKRRLCTVVEEEDTTDTISNKSHPKVMFYEAERILHSNPDLALELFQKSSKAGNLDAAFRVGYCHINGLGVTVDYDKGIDLIAEAAEAGHPHSQYTLASYYLMGFGKIPIDAKKAVDLLSKAAEAGHVDSMYRLAVCHHQAEGTEENRKLAFEWFLKAAEQGHPNGPYHVGLCYLKGHGVETDVDKASEWFGKAEGPYEIPELYYKYFIRGKTPLDHLLQQKKMKRVIHIKSSGTAKGGAKQQKRKK